MKGGIELRYNWEKDLEPYTSGDKIKELCRLVNNKRGKGQMIKWSVIVGDFLFVALLLVLIGVLNILNMEIDLRISLITGIIAFELAIVTFLSPIKSSNITKEQVNNTVGIIVTTDIMEKIRKTVEQKTSGIEKWLAVFGACGIFATVILKLIN